ncbi:MAG: sensor histidine kinase N-terminal domain-containing protein [Planctomycetes bacterium]|nr:sensor histidine kinase N-terminal domain-containing protein [Planctomycetota bacterium]
MWSLKSRLMYGMISGMAALLIGFDLVVYHAISHELFDQFDTSLKSAANLISASVEKDDGEDKFDFEFNIERMPEFAGGKKSAYYELWGDDGVVIRKSPSLGNDDIIRFVSDDRTHSFKSFKLKNGRPVRAIAMKFIPRVEDKSRKACEPKPLVLAVARGSGELLEQLRFLKYLLSIASMGILGLAYAVAEVVVRRGLSPLGAVAEQIDNISEDNLKSRIGGENLPDEIVPIQRKLNNLLERLEESFERERTFNANVAHELRTPLAGMRSIIDVALTRYRDTEEYRSALAESLSVVKNMEEMVSRLLMLARNESGQTALNKEQIKLAQMVDKCWEAFCSKADEAGIVFENSIDANFVCKSDAAGLSMIFSNLLSNAAEYTNRGGRITAAAQKTEHSIEIIFENTGNQLTKQHAQMVFDCFWQGDVSRSSTGVHFGLGLALVKQIVELLGGKIRAEVSGDLFSIHTYLPLI